MQSPLHRKANEMGGTESAMVTCQVKSQDESAGSLRLRSQGIPETRRVEEARCTQQPKHDRGGASRSDERQA